MPFSYWTIFKFRNPSAQMAPYHLRCAAVPNCEWLCRAFVFYWPAFLTEPLAERGGVKGAGIAGGGASLDAGPRRAK